MTSAIVYSIIDVLLVLLLIIYLGLSVWLNKNTLIGEMNYVKISIVISLWALSNIYLLFGIIQDNAVYTKITLNYLIPGSNTGFMIIVLLIVVLRRYKSGKKEGMT